MLERKEPHSLLRCPHCKEKLRLWLGPDLLCSAHCGAGARAEAGAGAGAGAGGVKSEAELEGEQLIR